MYTTKQTPTKERTDRRKRGVGYTHKLRYGSYELIEYNWFHILQISISTRPRINPPCLLIPFGCPMIPSGLFAKWVFGESHFVGVSNIPRHMVLHMSVIKRRLCHKLCSIFTTSYRPPGPVNSLHHDNLFADLVRWVNPTLCPVDANPCYELQITECISYTLQTGQPTLHGIVMSKFLNCVHQSIPDCVHNIQI